MPPNSPATTHQPLSIHTTTQSTQTSLAQITPVKDFLVRSSDADSVVLDGEILMVEKATGKPLPFGSLNVHKRNEYAEANVCVFLFDILYLNGETLMGKPMHERREILEANVNVIEQHIELSEKAVIRKEEDLAAMMDRVLAENLEGLVLKGLNGPYKPAARHWLKLKKDYLAGMADSLDLVVLGALYVFFYFIIYILIVVKSVLVCAHP